MIPSAQGCVRDEHEQFLQAYTRRFQDISTIAKAEATRMREVLHWLWNNYKKAAEVKSDYLQVAQAINSMHTNKIEFGSLIGMYRKLLCLSINCRLNYIMRQVNRIVNDSKSDN
jgi:hypothetical protein